MGDEAGKLRDGYNNGWVSVFENGFGGFEKPGSRLPAALLLMGCASSSCHGPTVIPTI